MSTKNYQPYRKKKSHNPSNFSYFLALIIVLAVLAIIIFSIYKDLKGNSSTSDPSSGNLPSSSQGSPSDSSGETDAGSPLSSGDNSLSTESDLPSSSSDIPESSSTAPVNATNGVDLSYFDDAVFIGDSRTEGLMLYSGVNNATYLTGKGLMVDTVLKKEVIKQADGSKISVIKALAQKTYGKVYIMFGLNELGWAYEDIFIERYGELVEEIKKVQPNATIYVQEIMPVSAKKSLTDKIFTNEKIKRYNELIQQMAKEKNLTFLKVGDAVKDETGALSAEATTDGIHLNKKYCEKWVTYLRENVAQQYQDLFSETE